MKEKTQFLILHNKNYGSLVFDGPWVSLNEEDFFIEDKQEALKIAEFLQEWASSESIKSDRQGPRPPARNKIHLEFVNRQGDEICVFEDYDAREAVFSVNGSDVFSLSVDRADTVSSALLKWKKQLESSEKYVFVKDKKDRLYVIPERMGSVWASRYAKEDLFVEDPPSWATYVPCGLDSVRFTGWSRG